jgi:hypothetical protein
MRYVPSNLNLRQALRGVVKALSMVTATLGCGERMYDLIDQNFHQPR